MGEWILRSPQSVSHTILSSSPGTSLIPPPCGLRVDFASLVLRAMSGSLSRRARLASVPNTSDPSAFFNVEGRVGRRRQHEGLGVSWSLSFDLD